jgi:hypothetical protein
MFPLRYELNSYILFRRNPVFKGLITETTLPYLLPIFTCRQTSLLSNCFSVLAVCNLTKLLVRIEPLVESELATNAKYMINTWLIAQI